jgi:hypothetical protein
MSDLDNKIEINQYTNNNISTQSENNDLNQSEQYHLKIYPKDPGENDQLSTLNNHIHSHNHEGHSCNHKKYTKKTYGNIGSNVVIFNKYVFGPLRHIFLWLFCASITIFGWLIWLYSVSDFYHKYLYYFLDILCIITEYYLIMAYITEPGIIPRNCPGFLPEDVAQIEEEDKDKPRIFTKRKCPTCNIIRPPGASHCGMCDNCVLDFDHHCAFISNCVGKRNHKYFVLFLVWGGLFAVLCTVLILAVIYNVIIKHSSQTISPIFHGSTIPFIIAIFLLYNAARCFCRPFPNYILMIILVIISFLIFWIIWYKNIDKKKVPGYFNPYLFLALGIALGLAIFIMTNLMAQLYLIGKSITLKQNMSIKEKIYENVKNKIQSESLKEYTKNLSPKERLSNIFKFFCSQKPPSLIVPERDLIPNK